MTTRRHAPPPFAPMRGTVQAKAGAPGQGRPAPPPPPTRYAPAPAQAKAASGGRAPAAPPPTRYGTTALQAKGGGAPIPPTRFGAAGTVQAWRTTALDNAFAAAKTGVFDTGHHKMPKSALKEIYDTLTGEQRRVLNRDLGMPSCSGVNSVLSLGSNLTFGPNSGIRLDDPQSNPDFNFIEKGLMSPRSRVYDELHQFYTHVFKARPEKTAPLSMEHFAVFRDALVKAERIHWLYVKQLIDTDTSMWLASGDGDKPYRKGFTRAYDPQEHLLGGVDLPALKGTKVSYPVKYEVSFNSPKGPKGRPAVIYALPGDLGATMGGPPDDGDQGTWRLSGYSNWVWTGSVWERRRTLGPISVTFTKFPFDLPSSPDGEGRWLRSGYDLSEDGTSTTRTLNSDRVRVTEIVTEEVRWDGELLT